MNDIKKIAAKIHKAILDILFPLVCICCKKHIDSDAEGPICADCLASIVTNRHINKVQAGLELMSVGNYEDGSLRTIIHAFKYERVRPIERTLDSLIKRYLDNIDVSKIIDVRNSVIIPIPLYPQKERLRGFNQAEIIANILGTRLKIKVLTGAIRRVKNTKPQISLASHKNRETNIKNSFALRDSLETYGEILKGKNIILVDDVYTSGSTIKEAIRVIRQLKPAKIQAFVIAKA